MKNRTPRVLVLGIALAMLLSALAAQAQGPEPVKTVADREGPKAPATPPMSNFVEIRVDDIPNLNPAVAYNSRQREFLVVWEEHIHGNCVAIYGRRVALSGHVIGSAFPIAEEDLRQYSLPDVAYSPAEDHYLVAWAYKFSADDYDIWARAVGGDGVPGQYVEIDTDYEKDWYPAVAYNSQANEFLVVYEKYVGDPRRDVQAQRVRAWDWSKASWRNLAGANDQIRRWPDVAYNAARNEYLVSYVYQTAPIPPVHGDIVALRSNSNMSWLSSEFYISPTGNPPQGGISLAVGPDEYLAAWDEEHGADQDSVWARRLGGDGNPLLPYINIAHITDKHNFESAVAYGDGGHYLVAWRTIVGTHPDWDWNIVGRFARSGTSATEGATFAIDEWGDMQKNPDVACAPSGPCLVVYEDNFGSADYDLRGRLVGHYRVVLPVVIRN
jgi:hypothetical protein